MILAIVEDEKREREFIKNCCREYLKARGTPYELFEFESGKGLLEYLEDSESKRIDILFLDVELPGLDGIQIKNYIISMEKVFRIVFVTGHEEFVYDAFGFKVMSFLKKPISTLLIGKQIDKILREMLQNVRLPIDDLKDVYLEDLLYIKSENNYVWVYLKNEKNPRLVTEKMKTIETKLKELPVIRIHKSYMVNLLEVANITNVVLMKNSEEIPLGRKYRQDAKTCFLEFKRKQIKGRME